MKVHSLDPNMLIGGVIAEDCDQQIVHLNLQKGNEVPPYEKDAIVTLVIVSGRAKIATNDTDTEVIASQVIRLEPNEKHTITALEDNTVIVAIKQLCYTTGLNRKLRFGNCCL